MRKHQKRIMVCVCAAVLLGVILTAAYGSYLARGGIRVLSTVEDMPQEVVCYRQQDIEWREERLGDSRYTIGTSGCITVCLASALQMQGIHVEAPDGCTPKTLNALFSAKGVYDGEGNLQWSVLEDLLSERIVREGVSGTTAEEIQTLISQGIYPICRVRMPVTGRGHYVLIVGSKDGHFQCMDPMSKDGETVSLERYHDRIYALRYIDAAK